MADVNFDLVARIYRGLEHLAFGQALEHCRTSLLSSLAPPRRALLLGEGDGRFLATFLHRYPNTEVDVIEPSARMIELARQRVGTRPNIRFRCEDARTASLYGPYDLVATHFFLDVLTEDEVRSLAQKLSSAAPGAQWLISEFHACEGALQPLSQIAIATMYAFFRITAGLRVNTIPDYETILESLGIRLEEERKAWAGFFSSQLWRIRP